MFTLNLETLEAVKANEGENLIKKAEGLKKVLGIKQMAELAKKYIAADFAFEKGTTKDAAAEKLFEAVCTNLGYTAEEIQAAKDLIEVVPEKPKKAPKAPKAPRDPNAPRKVWSKTYLLKKGRMPENTQEKTEMPFGKHAVVITNAISALIDSGKTEASREEIMVKAEELGLYTVLPSKQGHAPIFAWWRKSLADLGWLESKVEAAAVETSAA